MGRVHQVTSYLIDTHALIWALDGSERLSRRHGEILRSDAHVFVSMATLWEIASKKAIGKLDAPADIPGKIHLAGCQLLDISVHHIAALEALPFHHRDPLDRLLVAQAQVEGMTLMTADRELSAYGVKII